MTSLINYHIINEKGHFMKLGTFTLSLVIAFVQKDIKKRRKSYPSREEYRHFLDVPYIDDDNKYHKYDVYLADESNRKHVCVIDIHGGSYVFGEHVDNYPFAYVLLKAGFDVAVLDYLPNDGKKDIQDIVNDCALNLRHLSSNLDKFDLNKDKFVLAGDSAGGHLALLLSLALQNKSVRESMEVDLPKLDLVGTAICCPVYNYTNIGKDSMSNRALKRMKGPRFKDVEHMDKYSPHHYISYNKLPLLVSTCKLDFIRGESLALNKDMQGKPNYTFIDVNSDDKKVDHVHNVTKTSLKESIYVNNEIVKFIDKLI